MMSELPRNYTVATPGHRTEQTASKNIQGRTVQVKQKTDSRDSITRRKNWRWKPPWHKRTRQEEETQGQGVAQQNSGYYPVRPPVSAEEAEDRKRKPWKYSVDDEEFGIFDPVYSDLVHFDPLLHGDPDAIPAPPGETEKERRKRIRRKVIPVERMTRSPYVFHNGSASPVRWIEGPAEDFFNPEHDPGRWSWFARADPNALHRRGVRDGYAFQTSVLVMLVAALPLTLLVTRLSFKSKRRYLFYFISENTEVGGLLICLFFYISH